MDSRISIIEFVDIWDCSGITSYIVNFLSKMDNTKFDIKIVCAQKDYDGYDDVLKKIGYCVNALLDSKHRGIIRRTISTQVNLYGFLKQNPVEIIHLHVSNAVQLSYSMYAKEAGIRKVISHSHNSGFPNGKSIFKSIGHQCGKHIYNKYIDERISCSDLAAKWLYRTNDLCNVRVLPYIVDTKSFTYSAKDRAGMRRHYNVQDEIILLTVGGMKYHKNQLFLLQVCKEIFDKRSNVKLVFIGNGVLKNELHKKAMELKIDNRIEWIETTREVYKYMSMADVFLLPSLFEGNPLVGIEAQVNGLQCFFSDTITKDAKILDNAYFISLKESPKHWCENILEKLDIWDEDKRIEAAKTMQSNGYNINNQIYELESIYQNSMSD